MLPPGETSAWPLERPLFAPSCPTRSPRRRAQVDAKRTSLLPGDGSRSSGRQAVARDRAAVGTAITASRRREPLARKARQETRQSRSTTIKMRRIRPHPLESRALSSWGVSRSESLTSKPIGRPPASSVSRQNAKDFVKSLSGPKGDEGSEAQREGLPDCEDLSAILALRRGRAQQLWRGRQDPNPTLRVVPSH